MGAALDIAIGLVLMYLVLSLFCTTLNEFIANLLSLRATTLQAALEELIDDPNLRSLFYNHGLIDSARTASTGGAVHAAPAVATPAVVAPAAGTAIAPRIAPPPPKGFFARLWAHWTNTHPSYLSSKSVAMALIGSLGTTKQAPIPEIDSVVEAVVNGLPDCNIRDVLSTCIAQANGDIDKLRDSIATWFDSAMDRLSGAYKRFVQIISFVVGLLVAIGFNADTLKVTKTLWANPPLAASMAQSATQLVNANKGKATPSLPPSDKCQAPGGSANDFAKNAYQLCLADAYLQSGPLNPLPIGWTNLHWPCAHDFFDWLGSGAGWLQILGWLITAIALTLGAPFWFDLLTQFVNLRGTGQKPEPAKTAKAS